MKVYAIQSKNGIMMNAYIDIEISSDDSDREDSHEEDSNEEN